MRPWEQKRVFLFRHPRTASNLFLRMLSAQPGWETSDYLFFDSFQYTRDAFDGISLKDIPEAARREHDSLVETGHQKLEDFICAAMDKRKHVILRDHTILVTPVESTYGEEVESRNPSIFSDELMLSWRPVILIRNSIRKFESWLRAEGQPYPDLNSKYANIYTTLRFQGAIFDWYIHQTGCSLEPIMLDADDIIERRDVMERFCELVGMNKEKLLLSWEAGPTPAKFTSNERFKRCLQTFQEFTGIEQGSVEGGVWTGKSRDACAESCGSLAGLSVFAVYYETGLIGVSVLKMRRMPDLNLARLIAETREEEVSVGTESSRRFEHYCVRPQYGMEFRVWILGLPFGWCNDTWLQGGALEGRIRSVKFLSMNCEEDELHAVD